MDFDKGFFKIIGVALLGAVLILLLFPVTIELLLRWFHFVHQVMS